MLLTSTTTSAAATPARRCTVAQRRISLVVIRVKVADRQTRSPAWRPSAPGRTRPAKQKCVSRSKCKRLNGEEREAKADWRRSTAIRHPRRYFVQRHVDRIDVCRNRLWPSRWAIPRASVPRSIVGGLPIRRYRNSAGRWSIGHPEILRRAVRLLKSRVRVSSRSNEVEDAAPSASVIPCLTAVRDDVLDVAPGTIDPRGGQAAYDALLTAAHGCAMAGASTAITTAPLHKAALWQAGHHYPGPHRAVGRAVRRRRLCHDALPGAGRAYSRAGRAGDRARHAAHGAGRRLRHDRRRGRAGQDATGGRRDVTAQRHSAADRRLRAQSPRRRGRAVRQRGTNASSRRPSSAARPKGSTRSAPCRPTRLIRPGPRRRVRRRGGHVSRSGTHRDQAVGHAPRGERDAGLADRAHQRGPRHRVRHRLARPRRVDRHGRGAQGRGAAGNVGRWSFGG